MLLRDIRNCMLFSQTSWENKLHADLYSFAVYSNCLYRSALSALHLLPNGSFTVTQWQSFLLFIIVKLPLGLQLFNCGVTSYRVYIILCMMLHDKDIRSHPPPVCFLDRAEVFYFLDKKQYIIYVTHSWYLYDTRSTPGLNFH